MTPGPRIQVGIVGGSGYTGSELLRLLLAHPSADVVSVTSRTLAGQRVAEVHRALAGLTQLTCADFSAERLAGLDAVFVAVPHGESMGAVAALRQRNADLCIIDLGADFRLPRDVFERTYRTSHAAADLLPEAVYGLPELFREEIARARLVACPGCFAACITLGVAPLALARVARPEVRVSAVTGSTGSGATLKPGTHHPTRNESFSAYEVLTHRHVPEVERALGRAGGEAWRVHMVPQSGPYSRGIYAVAFAELSEGVDVQPLFEDFARRNRFVRLRADTPRLLDVRGSNFCDVAVYQDGAHVIVISALDNLVKGAAGSGIQCFNLIFGLDEAAGLTAAPLCP